MSDWTVCAPCTWCGYNGVGFYQPHTHDPGCPWYTIGGLEERKLYIVNMPQELLDRVAVLCEKAAAAKLRNPDVKRFSRSIVYDVNREPYEGDFNDE